ncbi:MAG: OmpA family protein [Rhodospirillaceae bacterium]
MKHTNNRYAIAAALMWIAFFPLLTGTAYALSDVDAYNATICNPVHVGSSGVPVITASSGIYVIHNDSFYCAPQVAQIASSPRAEFLVFFDWDKSDIKPDASRTIDEAVTSMQQVRLTRIDVTGHTDTTGSLSYNQALSERRAAAVKAELIRRGINPDAITTIGKSKTELLVPTADEVRERKNRRAQIVIVTN